jgi:hypothetical protein
MTENDQLTVKTCTRTTKNDQLTTKFGSPTTPFDQLLIKSVLIDYSNRQMSYYS